MGLGIGEQKTGLTLCACADFIVKNHGLDTEVDYAYWGWGLFCNSLREGR